MRSLLKGYLLRAERHAYHQEMHDEVRRANSGPPPHPDSRSFSTDDSIGSVVDATGVGIADEVGVLMHHEADVSLEFNSGHLPHGFHITAIAA